MNGGESGRSICRQRSLRGVGVALVVALGLLLWARLKLVTDTPRMVYADPPAGLAEGQPERGENHQAR